MFQGLHYVSGDDKFTKLCLVLASVVILCLLGFFLPARSVGVSPSADGGAPPLPGDANGNGLIDDEDLAGFLDAVIAGKTDTCTLFTYDVVPDGTLDVADLLLLSGLLSADVDPADIAAPRLLLGPMGGLTTSWHAAPASTPAPLGRTLLFEVTDVAPSVSVDWIGAVEVERGATFSRAEYMATEVGPHSVEVVLNADLACEWRASSQLVAFDVAEVCDPSDSFELLIGRVEGVTVAWERAPESAAAPRGSAYLLVCGLGGEAIRWVNAAPVEQTDDYALALVPLHEVGSTLVEVHLYLNGEWRTVAASFLDVVDAPLAQFRHTGAVSPSSPARPSRTVPPQTGAAPHKTLVGAAGGQCDALGEPEVFAGPSPPVRGSQATLAFRFDARQGILCFALSATHPAPGINLDGVETDIVMDEQVAQQYEFFPGNPDRIVFSHEFVVPRGNVGAGGTVKIDCDILLDPYNRAVLDVVIIAPSTQPQAAVRYLLRPCVDLDIDSDNNNEFDAPDRSAEEDEIENDETKPGRLVKMNDDDNDSDLVPDYADGFDWDEIADTDDDLNEEQEFVQLVVTVPESIDLSVAKVSVTYDESDPLGVTREGDEPPFEYEPAAGSLRIWTKAGNEQRDGAGLLDGGDFIPSDTYDASDLGLGGPTRSVTWYVEGITASAILADQMITVEVDLDGDGPFGSCEDVVRVTVFDVQYKTNDEADNLVEQEFSYNSVPCPHIQATVQDCSISSDGVVSLFISGIVTDEASDLVDDPRKQVQTLTISPESQYFETINLVNAAAPELPWKPYKFEANFATRVELVTSGFGRYQVSLTTSENVAGCAAGLNYFVVVGIEHEMNRYNIEFSGDLSEAEADVILFFVGEDEPVGDEMLLETGPNTRIFTSELFWADVEVEILSFDGLTGDVDTLDALMTFTYSNGQSKDFEADFLETGPTTARFSVDLSEPIDGPDLGGNLNLVLPPVFDDQTMDEVSIFMGDAGPGSEDFILLETTRTSLIFNGDATWADATVELINFQGLTDKVDTVVTIWTFTAPDRSLEILQLQLTETSPDSGHFVVDLGLENVFFMACGGEAETDPMTFLPTIIRIDAPSEAFDAVADRLHTFEADWEIQRKDFDDGEFWYVVDDQDNAVVFLPATYAESHIQTRPIEGEVVAELTKDGWNVAKKKVTVESGLVVDKEDPTSLLGNITNYEKSVYKKKLGDQTIKVFVFKPGDGFGHANTDLDTEILWRYVGTEKTVVVFKSKDELDNDLLYRQKVVDAARSVTFPFEVPTMLKPKFWVNDDQIVEEPPTTATQALANMFTAAKMGKYKMACFNAAQFVTQRGASLALDNFDALIGDKPYTNRWKVKKEEFQPNGTPIDNNHPNNAKWIPGDWGYIDNTFDGNDDEDFGLITGENVIYLGGSFDTAFAMFKQNADFWGHIDGARIKKLQEWMSAVEAFSCGPNMTLCPERYILRQ